MTGIDQVMDCCLSTLLLSTSYVQKKEFLFSLFLFPLLILVMQQHRQHQQQHHHQQQQMQAQQVPVQTMGSPSTLAQQHSSAGGMMVVGGPLGAGASGVGGVTNVQGKSIESKPFVYTCCGTEC